MMTSDMIRYRAPRGDRAGARPLLFIHGAYAGAWCWDRGFLDFFAERGWPCYAIDLPRDAETDAVAAPGPRLSDYADHVFAFSKELDAEPIYVSHCMGCAVVQQLLERDAPPSAAAFFSPTPLTGVIGPMLRLALNDPEGFQTIAMARDFGATANVDVDVFSRLFFSDPAAAANAEEFHAESPRALIDMAWLDLPEPERWPPTQAFVARGGRDRCLSAREAEEVAAAFDVPLRTLPGLGHALMLDSDWRVAADALADWLETV